MSVSENPEILIVRVDDVLFTAVHCCDRLPTCRKSCRTVMHHGGKIIGSPQRVDISLDVEVESHTSHNVSHVNPHVLVTIRPRLFME